MEKNKKEIQETLGKIEDGYKVHYIFHAITVVIIAVLVALLVTCKKEEELTNDLEKKAYETIDISKEPFEYITDADIQTLDTLLENDNYIAADVMYDGFFNGLGYKLPAIETPLYDGTLTNLSDIKSPIVLIVTADWCQYCQVEARDELNKIIEANPDVTFIQYMETGGKNEYDVFYDEAGVKPNENLILACYSQEISDWLSKCNFKSYPTFYFINNLTVEGCQVGALDSSLINATAKIAFNNVLTIDSLKTADGEKLKNVIRKQIKAKEYIANLTQIDVPKEYLD